MSHIYVFQMKRIFSTLLLSFPIIFLFAQESMDYFLPEDVSYNEEIPTPEHYFKQQLGEWHLTHGQVLDYMNQIVRISDRAMVYEYARSYENKPLIHLVFTSKENHENLEELKKVHSKFSDPGENIPLEGVPLVVSLSYGVHGNESSATNSSVLTAYYLAAAQGEKIDKLLGNTIIIMDPCLNPDGFTRHTTWTNTYQSVLSNGDNNSEQFYEIWPKGRTNHYWFDLNRDYLPLINPESRGRVAKFHEWKPNIVTDHHESTRNITFFFQPGVPTRNNPLTPEYNYKLTTEIAKYHARSLDAIGSSYFSEEIFDDYYFGKGSSYPDINGSVGILFEQSAFRGRIRETYNGLLKLSLSIKNQFTVTLSTLDAAMDMRTELLNYQREFYRSALELGKESSTKAYVFGSETDRMKIQKFVKLLNQHQIDVFQNPQDLTINGVDFKGASSYIVPVEQSQYRLITSIFEEVTSFRDTTFYDVSTWTLPYAFNIPFARLTSLKNVQVRKETVTSNPNEGEVVGGRSRLGYIFRWTEYSAPDALFRLQEAGLMTKVATRDFSQEFEGNLERFMHGTILVNVNHQSLDEQQIWNLVSEIVRSTGVTMYGLETLDSPVGIDMGSPSLWRLKKPEAMMFIGNGTSSYDAGSLWHLLDQNYHIPVTLIRAERMRSLDLNDYTRIILPGGAFQEWNEDDVEKLKTWVSSGGVLIACNSATKWAAKNELGQVKFKDQVPSDSTRYLRYADRRKESAIHGIGGAIFRAKMDHTHPLCYGYEGMDVAVFKRGASVAESMGTKYAEPVTFTMDPYVSGWVSEENLERIKGAPVVSVQSIGKGKLISYYEYMNFRGFWYGTHKLFMNSFFFGDVIN